MLCGLLPLSAIRNPKAKYTQNNRCLATLVEKPPSKTAHQFEDYRRVSLGNLFASMSLRLWLPHQPPRRLLQLVALSRKELVILPCHQAETGMRDRLEEGPRIYRSSLVLERSDLSIPKKAPCSLRPTIDPILRH